MKKSFISLLSLAALMSLAGCGGTSEVVTNRSTFKPSLTPTEIMCNSYSESMYVGESYSIQLLITPLLASDAEIVYSSSDESIASVSDSGVISAKKKGAATITVMSKKNPDVKKTISIRVFNKNGVATEAGNTLDGIKFYQIINNIGNPKKLKTEQVKTYYLYKNDSLFSKSVQYNNMIVDKDNGYVYFGGRDSYTYIDGGNTSRDFGVWQLYTDEDYHSYIYHDSVSGAKYLPVATEFNLGTDKTRIDTVYGILDSLFTNGRDLIENCVEDSMGSDWYDFPHLAESFGDESKTNEFYFLFKQSSDKGISTPTMETNLDIPAYIPYTEEDYFKVYWDRGVVKTYVSNFSMTYEVKGVKHQLVIEERNTFTRDDFDIDPIDHSKYTKADDIYDL